VKHAKGNALIETVRALRNLLHSGRHLDLPPHWNLEAVEAEGVRAILVIMEFMFD
jgi:hypothetical protein